MLVISVCWNTENNLHFVKEQKFYKSLLFVWCHLIVNSSTRQKFENCKKNEEAAPLEFGKSFPEIPLLTDNNYHKMYIVLLLKA